VATAELKLLIKGQDEASKVLGQVERSTSALAASQGLRDLREGSGAIADRFLSMGEAASQLELQGRKSLAVFGDELANVERWASENATAMGLTSQQATGLAANFADLLIPMGFARDEAAGMATDVVGLSGALAEWSGGQRTASEVSQILAKAMLGERDGLKELGISISEADVQVRLLAKGQKELTGTALEQAKALATQELILEKSKDAQAAYAEGADTASRAQSEFNARMAEAQAEMQQKLLPVYAETLSLALKLPAPVLAAGQAFLELAPAIGQVAIGLKAMGPLVSGLISSLPMMGSALMALGPIGLAAAAGIGAAYAAQKLFGDDSPEWVNELQLLGDKTLQLARLKELHAEKSGLERKSIEGFITTLQGQIAAEEEAARTAARLRGEWGSTMELSEAMVGVLDEVTGQWIEMHGAVDGDTKALQRNTTALGLQIEARRSLFEQLGAEETVLRAAMGGSTPGDFAGSGVPGFEHGGVVPGPRGAPQLAVVHGGEQVLTASQQAGGGDTSELTQAMRDLTRAIVDASARGPAFTLGYGN
jgi:hypothetical protein